MDANDVLASGLGVTPPWKLVSQRLDTTTQPNQLHLEVAAERGALFPCPTCGFFDVSGGLEEVPQGRGDQVDHDREGCGVAVAAGSGAGCLEQAAPAFEAGIAVRRCPALEDGLSNLKSGLLGF